MKKKKTNKTRLTMFLALLLVSTIGLFGCGKGKMSTFKVVQKMDPLVKPTYEQALKRAKEVSVTVRYEDFDKPGLKDTLMINLFLPDEKKYLFPYERYLEGFATYIRHNMGVVPRYGNVCTVCDGKNEAECYVPKWEKKTFRMYPYSVDAEKWIRYKGGFKNEKAFKREMKRLNDKFYRRLAKLFMQHPKVYQLTSLRYHKFTPEELNKESTEDFPGREYLSNRYKFFWNSKIRGFEEWMPWLVDLDFDDHRIFRVVVRNRPNDIDEGWRGVVDGEKYGYHHVIHLDFSNLDFKRVLSPWSLYAIFEPHDPKKGFEMRSLKEYTRIFGSLGILQDVTMKPLESGYYADFVLYDVCTKHLPYFTRNEKGSCCASDCQAWPFYRRMKVEKKYRENRR